VAMELALNGVEVDLYEKNAAPMSQASSSNEGKIHLGFVYANDPTLNTARMMIQGAIVFEKLLRRWLGDEAVDAIPVSSPFYYVVHAESMLSINQVETHLRACCDMLWKASEGVAAPYFGSDYLESPTRLSAEECAELYHSETITAAFRTPEIALDTEVLGRVTREALGAFPGIRLITGAHVHGVEPGENQATVDFERDGRRQTAGYDHVVNTLWEGRLAVDHTAGIRHERSWLYRVKHFVRLPATDFTLPSTTIVLGPFGDIVEYGNGAKFLSWYPVGMLGSSSELAPPAWPTRMHGEDAAEIRRGTLDALERIVPAVGDLPEPVLAESRVRGGVIFAWGETDIDDHASELHERHAIGPQSWGRYHSVDTGKLTMAPYFGKMLAERLLA
jgi:hypothetical protein